MTRINILKAGLSLDVIHVQQKVVILDNWNLLSSTLQLNIYQLALRKN